MEVKVLVQDLGLERFGFRAFRLRQRLRFNFN